MRKKKKTEKQEEESLDFITQQNREYILMNYVCVNAMQDKFNKFKEEGGGFKASLREDAMGLLSMYEAAHLGVEGEAILEEAKVFSIKKLKILKERVERKQHCERSKSFFQ
ncbi:putative terpene synthase 9 [Cinnamomum micranthum f. kanehirae]|uniref:Putative terpene synthase 9 n=1 Tax=Cinnamomum micranthum f. kanehirae TaxID=337451 RepID=A0A3S3MIZ5_9MAGN|nr:putative terpene synthase 9 [Cinnamomum micranthum f. kanehirae]